MVTSGFLSCEFGRRAISFWKLFAAVALTVSAIGIVRHTAVDPYDDFICLECLAWLTLFLPVLIAIMDGFCFRKEVRAARIVNNMCWRNRSYSLSETEAVRKTLRQIADEMTALVKVNPDRNLQLKAKFAKLFDAAKELSLITNDDWNEYFTSKFELRPTPKKVKFLYKDSEVKEPPTDSLALVQMTEEDLLTADASSWRDN